MTDLHLTIEELRLRRSIALLAMDKASSAENWTYFLLETLRLNNLVEIGEASEADYQRCNKSA